MLSQAVVKTPIGSLYLISHEQLLLASGFESFASLQSRLEKIDQGRKFVTEKRIPVITDLVEDYFDGSLGAIDGISVRQLGEKFSQSAWKAMRKVPAGKTLSYADLAKRAGSAEAVRAAGTACARNLVALVVPCHRIVRTGGALGNYAYGLKAKEWLLNHEGALK